MKHVLDYPYFKRAITKVTLFLPYITSLLSLICFWCVTYYWWWFSHVFSVISFWWRIRTGPRDPKRINRTSSLIVTLSFLKHMGYSNHLWLSSASTTFLFLLEEIGTSLFFQFFVFYSWISRVSNVHDLSLLHYCCYYYIRCSGVVGNWFSLSTSESKPCTLGGKEGYYSMERTRLRRWAVERRVIFWSSCICWRCQGFCWISFPCPSWQCQGLP